MLEKDGADDERQTARTDEDSINTTNKMLKVTYFITILFKNSTVDVT